MNENIISENYTFYMQLLIILPIIYLDESEKIV